MTAIKQGFGLANPDCTKCGDERGGPPGHGADTCGWFPGTSVYLLTLMPHMAGRAGEIWDTYIDRYMDAHLGSESAA